MLAVKVRLVVMEVPNVVTDGVVCPDLVTQQCES